MKFAAQATASPADVSELANIDDNEVVLLIYTVNYCDLMNMFILLLCVCLSIFLGVRKTPSYLCGFLWPGHHRNAGDGQFRLVISMFFQDKLQG